MTRCCLQIVALLSTIVLWPNAANCNPAAVCRCVASNSTYLTTTATAATTTTTTAITTNAAATTTTGATTARPHPGFILLNTSSSLSAAFTAGAFNSSTYGYTYESSNNLFTVPGGAGEPHLVIDLLVGSSGDPCRSMSFLDQICVSNQCPECNLNQFTVSAATTLIGDSAFQQRIFYPTHIVNTTVCAGRNAFQHYGDFRYIVFLPMSSPNRSQPYGFKVSMSGNFSSYNCGSSRRKRSLDIVGRIRRAVPNDCSCPVGQDPVFLSVRTVLITWMYHFSPIGVLSNTSSAEYMALASESYYLLMDAVRNSSASNLTSVVVNFFDIAFSSVGSSAERSAQFIPRGAPDWTKLSGKMTVRNDSYYSDNFLLDQLKAIIPGYGSRISDLSVGPVGSSKAEESPSGLPGYAIALICFLCLAILASIVIVVLWRLNLIGKLGDRFTQYEFQNHRSEPTGPTGPSGPSPTDDGAEKPVDELKMDASIQMPNTAFNDYQFWKQDATCADYENLGADGPIDSIHERAV